MSAPRNATHFPQPHAHEAHLSGASPKDAPSRCIISADHGRLQPASVDPSRVSRPGRGASIQGGSKYGLPRSVPIGGCGKRGGLGAGSGDDPDPIDDME